MIGNYSARLTGSKRNLLALLASSAVFTVGCTNMATTAPSANPFSSPATLSGTIHGGNQPVVGATVSLWFVGQGSGASAFPATKGAVTTSDSKGSFSFTKGSGGNGTTSTYTCPTSVASSLVYVISQGGNTQNNGVSGQNNSAAAFIALYGDCQGLTASNFVYMSEVTTVATMAAVQQFFNPLNNDTLSADNTGQQRLIMLNLPNTVNILANAATGLANASLTIGASASGSIAPGVALTATPEVAKINTLANIISACINAAASTDPNCTSLFSAATPPTPNLTNLNPGPFPAATDTLQALYYIFTNPTNGGSSNMTTLFGLQPAVGAPYQPALSSKPNDWTIGVSYAASGSSTTCGTPTGGSGNFISSPTDITIDGSDNVWFGNAAAGGNLSAISAAGAPLYCVNFDAGTSNAGGAIDSGAGGNTPNPNVWFAGGTTLYRYNPVSKATLAFPVAVTPLAIAADGLGNVFFTASAGSTGSVYEIVNGANAAAVVAPVLISNSVGASPLRLMPDYQNCTNTVVGSSTVCVANPVNLWVSSGTNSISQVAPSTAVGNTNGYVTNPFTTSGNSWGIAVSRNGIFTSAVDSGAITQLNATTHAVVNGFPFTGPAGMNAPKGIAVDGRSNTWIANSGAPSISEISVFGGTNGAITPSTGYVKDASLLNSNRAIAVDQAGNVWIAGTGNAFITEIIGEGVPIYAPFAVGIANGRFQTIP